MKGRTPQKRNLHARLSIFEEKCPYSYSRSGRLEAPSLDRSLIAVSRQGVSGKSPLVCFDDFSDTFEET